MSKLETHLGQQIAAAERADNTRDTFLDRYLGEKYGDEVEGRSSVVTSEVFDVVESITAEMMDVLTSADQIVTFGPSSAADEQAAEDETDACNAVFWEKNPGFENLQSWVKSGLIEQVGYVRSGWAEKRDVSIEEYKDVPALAVDLYLQQTLAQPDVTDATIIEQTGEGNTVSFRAKVVRNRYAYEIEPLPQDQVLVKPRWRKLSLQDCPFVAIRDDSKTKSDLRAMGFSREDVDALGNEVEDKRRFEAADNTEDEPESTITIYEVYTLFDLDGDGIDERVKCWCSSNEGKLLRWEDGSDAVEEVDSVPIYAWTPILVPHRHSGRGVAEITDDIQRQNTVLMRSLFDSVYATLYRRPVVNTELATKDTWADLALPDHGAPIRVKGPGAIEWSGAPQIIGDILPALQRMDAIKEERTGVSRLAQGLDRDTLNSTASGQAVLMNQSQKRIRLIARNMAEYGLKDLFVGMHRDLRKGNWPQLEFRRANGWAQVEPASWPPRAEMKVGIGTGNGDREEKRQTLMMALQAQRELLTAGSPMVDEARLYATIDRLIRLGGLPSAAPFFLDPASPEYQAKAQAKAQQPQQPDPNMVLAQAEMAKAQSQAKKAEYEANIALIEKQQFGEQSQREHEARMAELNVRLMIAQTERAKAAAAIDREDKKLELQAKELVLDEQFRRDEMAVEAQREEAKRQETARQAQETARQSWLSRMFGRGQ